MLNKKVEILAPAGSVTGLQASFKAGADAVYMGGTRFGARAYADNADDTGLLYAIDYAHLHGKKLYLTVNTMIKEKELESVYDYLLPLYREGLDAVIVQDLGVVKLVHDFFPGLDIHLSTQMSMTDESPLKWLPDSVTRIVPARELTLTQIEKLKKNSGLELEVFIHGALCYSYSGHCLFSSMCGDRSGNRGRCAQPCRKLYEYQGKKAYILSPKDICTLDNFHELIKAGVDSFKIEGRMKVPEYAAGVTEIYRREVDRFYTLGEEKYLEYKAAHAGETAEEKIMLMDLFNRGGFSSGYAFGNPGPDMMSGKRPNHHGVFIGKAVLNKEFAELVNEIPLNKGDVLEIRSDLSKEWYSYTCGHDFKTGSKIKFRALKSIEQLKGRYENRETGKAGKRREISGSVTVEVYRMRNEALLDRLHKEYIEKPDKKKASGKLRLVVGEVLRLDVQTELAGKTYSAYAEGLTADAAKTAALDEKSVREKVLRSGDSMFELAELEIFTDNNSFVPKAELGRVRREALYKLEKEIKASLRRELKVPEFRSEKKDASGLQAEAYSPEILVRYLLFGQKKAVEEFRQESADIMTISTDKYYFDFSGLERYTVSNSFAADFLHGSGEERLTLGHELDKEELSELMEKRACAGNSKTILDIYGRELVMVSRQCIKKNFGKCRKSENGFTAENGKDIMMEYFTDTEGRKYPFYTDCSRCINYIFDSEPTDIRALKDDIEALRPDYVRFTFTTETPAEIKKILSGYFENTAKGGKYGHFLRTVQ
ncbi:MAG: U32 family peptidase [Lachnospiraceae bacterium]|nr:U32 family peptidase [Lachnospiraceae bacterium]